MIAFWILILAFISVAWALISLKREHAEREINEVKKEIAKGKVIFHSSKVSDSSS